MTLVLPTVVAAVAVGYALGGRLGRLADASLRRAWLVAVAVIAQAAIVAVATVGGRAEAVALPLLVVSQVALLGFLWVNRRLPGMPLVVVGFALNAAVILANGAMPVAPEALRAVAGEPVAIEAGKHRVLTDGDRLPLLADVIPVPLLRTVVSVGDVVLALGVAILLVRLMRRPADDPAHERGTSRVD